jgi:hypothetical protein
MDSPEELEEKVAPQQFVAQGDHSSTQEIGDRTSPPGSPGILESDFKASTAANVSIVVLPNFQSINAVGHIRVLIGTYAIIYTYNYYIYISVVIPGYCLRLLTNVTFAHGISWKSTCVGRCPNISIEQSVYD